jgi:hypothetical protein
MGERAAGPPPEVFGRWVRVPEEEQPGGDRIYRPAGHPLPPARGRDGIEFYPDGGYRRWQPGPVDAPVADHPGRWSTAGPARLRLHPPGDPGAGTVIRVVSVTPDRLVLRWPDLAGGG